MVQDYSACLSSKNPSNKSENELSLFGQQTIASTYAPLHEVRQAASETTVDQKHEVKLDTCAHTLILSESHPHRHTYFTMYDLAVGQ